MTRYRIVIEIDSELPRAEINNLTKSGFRYFAQSMGNPVYCATEIVTDKERSIHFEKGSL